MGLALSGTVLLTGVDLSISGRALFGDLLALGGGFLAAAYVPVGSEVRRTLTTTVYALGCYAVAGLGLLAVCLVSGPDLTGYDRHPWLAIGGLLLGAQLPRAPLLERVPHTLSPPPAS